MRSELLFLRGGPCRHSFYTPAILWVVSVVPRKKIPFELATVLLSDMVWFDRMAQIGHTRAREKLLKKYSRRVHPKLFQLIDKEVFEKIRDTRYYVELYAYATHI